MSILDPQLFDDRSGRQLSRPKTGSFTLNSDMFESEDFSFHFRFPDKWFSAFRRSRLLLLKNPQRRYFWKTLFDQLVAMNPQANLDEPRDMLGSSIKITGEY